MNAPLAIYLAGPEVFLSNAREVGEQKRRLCRAYGFEGLFPLDNDIADGDHVDRRIFDANMAFIRRADLGIFNLTPFRGISADVGTVFELGVFIGLGKPVFAYSNDATNFFDRVERDVGTSFDETSQQWHDPLGMSVENFGNADNLMIDAALAAQGRRFHRTSAEEHERVTDLHGFVACLEEAHGTVLPVSRSKHERATR